MNKSILVHVFCFLLGALAFWGANTIGLTGATGKVEQSKPSVEKGFQNQKGHFSQNPGKMARSESELPQLLAILKAQNVPPEVLYVVATSILRKESLEKFQRAQFSREPSRWQLRVTRLNEDQRRESREVAEEVQAKVRALLGEDYSVAKYSGNIDPRIGGLAGVEKWTRAEELKSDYEAATRGKNLTNKSLAELEDRFKNELRDFLSPEELNDYLAFNSPTARELQTRFIGATMNDSTYLAAYAAYTKLLHKTKESSEPHRTYANRIKEIDIFQEIVPPKDLATFSTNSDRTFKEVALVFTSSKQTDEMLVQKYKAWLEFHDEIGALESGGLDPATRSAKRKSAAEKAYGRLSSGLDTEGIAALNNTKTGGFLQRMLQSQR